MALHVLEGLVWDLNYKICFEIFWQLAFLTHSTFNYGSTKSFHMWRHIPMSPTFRKCLSQGSKINLGRVNGWGSSSLVTALMSWAEVESFSYMINSEHKQVESHVFYPNKPYHQFICKEKRLAWESEPCLYTRAARLCISKNWGQRKETYQKLNSGEFSLNKLIQKMKKKKILMLQTAKLHKSSNEDTLEDNGYPDWSLETNGMENTSEVELCTVLKKTIL